MRILAVDTSSNVASVAIVDENKLVCECVLNNKLTHSQTLMPMIDEVFKKSELNIDNIKKNLEYLMGASVRNIRNLKVDSVDRYYAFDFEDKNILSTYKYISIDELNDIELLREIKDCLD